MGVAEESEDGIAPDAPPKEALSEGIKKVHQLVADLNMQRNVETLHTRMASLSDSLAVYFARHLFPLATSSATEDDKYMEVFLHLLISRASLAPSNGDFAAERLDWLAFAEIVRDFEAKEMRKDVAVKRLCYILEEVYPLISCTDSSRIEERNSLRTAIVSIFIFLVTSVYECFSSGYYSSWDRLAEVLHIYSSNEFYANTIRTLFVVNASDKSGKELMSATEKLRRVTVEGEGDTVERTRESALRILQFKHLPKYEGVDSMKNHLFRTFPVVRTAAAVFAFHRCCTPVEEMMDSIVTVGSIVGMDREMMLKDLFRTAFFMLASEKENGRDISSMRYFMESFTLNKLPAIIKLMLKKKEVTSEDISKALQYTRKDSRQVIESLNENLSGDFWAEFVETLATTKVIDKQLAKELVSVGGKQKTETHQKPEIMVQAAVACFEKKAGRIFDGGEWETHVENMLTMSRFGGIMWDGTMADLGPALSSLTSSIAQFNQSLEAPSQREGRWKAFDVSFTLLVRAYLAIPRLSLTELLNGPKENGRDNRTGVFYRFALQFIRRNTAEPFFGRLKELGLRLDEETGEPPHTEEELAGAEAHLRTLERGEMFFQHSNVHFDDIVMVVPLMGIVLLRDVKDHHYNLEKILLTLRKGVSLTTCLILFLHSLPHGEGRKTLAGRIEEIFRNQPPSKEEDSEGLDRWQFTWRTLSGLLREMAEGKRIKDSVTIQFHTLVHRPQPPLLARTESPDKEQLKKAWAFALRQEWAVPSVLAILEACNHAGLHQGWLNVWMNQLFKQFICDDLIRVMELIIGASLLDPLPCFREMCRSLGDVVFPEKESSALYAGLSHPQHRAPTGGVFCSRFVAVTLTLSMWAVNCVKKKLGMKTKVDREAVMQRYKKVNLMEDMAKKEAMAREAEKVKKAKEEEKNKGEEAKENGEGEGGEPPAKRVKIGVEEEEEEKKEEVMEEHKLIADPEDDRATMLAHMEELEECIMCFFVRMGKACERGVLSDKCASICLMLRELAMTGTSEGSRCVAQFLPPSIMFDLIRMEPASVTFPLFCHFHQSKDQATADEMLRFVCYSRKASMPLQ